MPFCHEPCPEEDPCCGWEPPGPCPEDNDCCYSPCPTGEGCCDAPPVLACPPDRPCCHNPCPADAPDCHAACTEGQPCCGAPFFEPCRKEDPCCHNPCADETPDCHAECPANVRCCGAPLVYPNGTIGEPPSAPVDGPTGEDDQALAPLDGDSAVEPPGPDAAEPRDDYANEPPSGARLLTLRTCWSPCMSASPSYRTACVRLATWLHSYRHSCALHV